MTQQELICEKDKKLRSFNIMYPISFSSFVIGAIFRIALYRYNTYEGISTRDAIYMSIGVFSLIILLVVFGIFIRIPKNKDASSLERRGTVLMILLPLLLFSLIFPEHLDYVFESFTPSAFILSLINPIQCGLYIIISLYIIFFIKAKNKLPFSIFSCIISIILTIVFFMLLQSNQARLYGCYGSYSKGKYEFVCEEHEIRNWFYSFTFLGSSAMIPVSFIFLHLSNITYKLKIHERGQTFKIENQTVNNSDENQLPEPLIENKQKHYILDDYDEIDRNIINNLSTQYSKGELTWEEFKHKIAPFKNKR
ncbi:MAG: hypothetical protein HUJ61_04050 [Bacilli bacterium]|nr:hypothetical protein [Bacilli bacterium]